MSFFSFVLCDDASPDSVRYCAGSSYTMLSHAQVWARAPSPPQCCTGLVAVLVPCGLISFWCSPAASITSEIAVVDLLVWWSSGTSTPTVGTGWLSGGHQCLQLPRAQTAPILMSGRVLLRNLGQKLCGRSLSFWAAPGLVPALSSGTILPGAV